MSIAVGCVNVLHFNNTLIMGFIEVAQVCWLKCSKEVILCMCWVCACMCAYTCCMYTSVCACVCVCVFVFIYVHVRIWIWLCVACVHLSACQTYHTQYCYIQVCSIPTQQTLQHTTWWSGICSLGRVLREQWHTSELLSVFTV